METTALKASSANEKRHVSHERHFIMISNLSHCFNFLHRLFNIFDQTSFISRLATRHAALLNVCFAFWKSSQPHLLHPPQPPPPLQAQPPAPLLLLGERRPRGMNIVSLMRHKMPDDVWTRRIELTLFCLLPGEMRETQLAVNIKVDAFKVK